MNIIQKRLQRSALTLLVFAYFVSPVLAAGDDDLLSILSGSSDGKTQAVDVAPYVPKESLLRKMFIENGVKVSAEQTILVDFFDRGLFDKALYQWPAAFENDPTNKVFSVSATGRALKAYLQLQNGIRIVATESLLSIEKPAEIAPYVAELWKAAVPAKDTVWQFVSLELWKPHWGAFFGDAIDVAVLSRKVYGPDQIDALKDLLKRAENGTRERAWLGWNLVVALSLGDNAGLAGKALAHLMTVPQNPVSRDLMTITAARLLYQNGYLDAAIKYYGEVPKSSDYWVDAQEEMGWSYIRKGEPQNSLAITKTLTFKGLIDQVGPEAVFLQSLAQLKVCDYPKVIESLNSFRTQFRDRTAAMVGLVSERIETDAVRKFIERSKAQRLKLAEVGPSSRQLPRQVARDELLYQLVQIEKAMETEAKTAGELYARSLSGGTAQVGFQAALEQTKNAVEGRARSARSATLDRIKVLAKEELDQTQRVLQKMHIVEAEVIQQLGLAKRVADATAQKGKGPKNVGTTGSKGRDTIWFPAENETWFDELANYKVDVAKGCRAVKQ